MPARRCRKTRAATVGRRRGRRPLREDGRFVLDRERVRALRVEWSWDEAARQAVVDVSQIQGGEPYELDLALAFRAGDIVERRTVTLRRVEEPLRLPLPFAPEAVEADPDGWLLHSATIRPR